MPYEPDPGSREAPPHGRSEPEFALAHPRLSLLVIAAVVAWGALQMLGPRQRPAYDPDAKARPVAARGDLAADEKESIAIFQQASPSVVNIATSQFVQTWRGFRRAVAAVPEGTGSGFVWDDEGHVVTNYHVIRSADAAKVTFGDGSQFDARLVGAVPQEDIAVLVVDAPSKLLHPILVGSSSNLQVGQKAFAIGYPFGIDQSFAAGVVSGLDRTIESIVDTPIEGVIQTDAAINPGNSGGPLLDSSGRLIGMNTAIASRSGSSSGVGFAIPVDKINRIAPALIRKEPVTSSTGRARLGIVFSLADAERFGVQGIVIQSVQPGSGAAAAGLVGTTTDAYGRTILGDVILAIDGNPILDPTQLMQTLARKKPGDTVTLTLERGAPSQRHREEVQVELSS